MSEAIKSELELIRQAHPAGALDPADVVAFARSENTVLHSRFEWDDSKAGELYRLEQARKIIRVVVEVLPRTDGQAVIAPVYVSEPGSRRHGGGYTRTDQVIGDDARRRLLTAQTIRQARSMLERCAAPELDKITHQLDRIEKRLRAGLMLAAG